MRRIIYISLFAFLLLLIQNKPLAGQEKPNVIIVLTDDQGIGDLGCHGNPYIKTPHIDKFYKESIRMTDFHVSPLCTPTRSAIISGQYPINNGAWATYKGRDALTQGTPTIASIFKQNGYKTGIFGKWHLGDNYPVRPTDCGFDIAIHHKAGGVGELSDYWGNSYFNDTYFVNNQPQQFKGYCTDVWFQEAIKFIEETKDQPFFIYLPTNAPHDPLIVDKKYSQPYNHLVGKEIYSAEFYGMITNLDENFGKLDQYLKTKGLADNTILVFMTDNGTGNGVSKDLKIGYNKGFRGKKGHRTEGGHRVPFFIRWPQGKVKGGKDMHQLTAHVDMIPTLAGLCNINVPNNFELDGIDFSLLLLQKTKELPPRTVFVHNRQGWRPPFDIDQTCIMTQKWRLINGQQLYEIDKDLAQKNNIAQHHPKVVDDMLKSNAQFVKRAKARKEYQEFPYQVIGNKHQKEIKLTIQHAIGEGKGIWKAEQVAAGMKNKNNTHAIKVEKSGLYKISCCRWPRECPGPIWGIPTENPKGGMYNYKTIKPTKARIQIANQMVEKEIKDTDKEVVFEVNLQKGKTFLVNDFIEGNNVYGVYYTYINYLGTK